MKISKNFSREEFKCKCCDFATVDVELLKLLETIREHFNSPVNITSGCRCRLHNVAVGGSFNSKHMEGVAADIVVTGIQPKDVYDFVDAHAPNKYGIGSYKSFTHVDVRNKKARWTGK